LACSADGRKLVAASGGGGDFAGRIYLSTDSGVTWAVATAPTTNWVSVACSADGNHLVALVGKVDLQCSGSFYSPGGPIYISTNSGANWMPSSAPTTNWTSVASSADGTKLVAAAGGLDGPAGAIYLSADGGRNWTASSAPVD